MKPGRKPAGQAPRVGRQSEVACCCPVDLPAGATGINAGCKIHGVQAGDAAVALDLTEYRYKDRVRLMDANKLKRRKRK